MTTGITPDHFKKCVTSVWFLCALCLLAAVSGCRHNRASEKVPPPGTWADRLGFPPGKRVIIFHADDIGMCEEANEAVIPLLKRKEIQSAAAMPPCPAFEDAIEWAKANPDADIGLHLTLNSEMKSPRWGTVADPKSVPGLLTPEGVLWRRQSEVVEHATGDEIERELRAQIEKTLRMGYRPTHLDSHMGTVFGTADFLEVYLKLAEDYHIPAMVIHDPEAMEHFMKYVSLPPPTAAQKQLIADYSLPKLDNYLAIKSAKTYPEKKALFFETVRSLEPGLIEIIFHPQVKSERSESITASWQQRVWEAELFSDPEVQSFLDDERILLTNWKEIMQRFEKMKP
ncbi:MAG: polysaccharide deacetylase family protein [Cyclobacteriaceae bacterium]